MDEILKREAVRNMRKNPSSRTRENEYWSEEELERLRTMFDDGEDFTNIAFVLQRGETAVMQQALLMNLYSRKPRPRKQQKTQTCKCLCGQCSSDPRTCPYRLHLKNQPKKRRRKHV